MCSYGQRSFSCAVWKSCSNCRLPPWGSHDVLLVGTDFACLETKEIHPWLWEYCLLTTSSFYTGTIKFIYWDGSRLHKQNLPPASHLQSENKDQITESAQQEWEVLENNSWLGQQLFKILVNQHVALQKMTFKASPIPFLISHCSFTGMEQSRTAFF